MDNLIKKLLTLSSLECSEDEIADFKNDFSDILPLIDTISEFDLKQDDNSSGMNFSALRPDTPEKSNFDFKTKSVPKVI